jgi:hypothetical protein
MNTRGTIDRPAEREPAPVHPKKQVPTMNPATDYPNADTEPGAVTTRQNRNTEMQLMPEALARAQYQERLREADAEREANRLLLARRLQRQAERAQLRARRALAMAVMQ